MNNLRSLPINRRLWLILVVAIVMLIIQGALLLKQIEADLYAAKSEKTQHVVQSAAGILQHYHTLEAAGGITREAAQKQAAEIIRNLRYDGQEYFWINDQTPVMVMHQRKQIRSGNIPPHGKTHGTKRYRSTKTLLCQRK